jgi:Double zinc ribbon
VISAMHCPFCENDNPADSRFCNACGAQLNLAPCLRCGAVNEARAETCFQCHARLSGDRVESDITITDAEGTPEPPPRSSAEHRFEIMESITAESITAAAPDMFAGTSRTDSSQRSHRFYYAAIAVLVLILVAVPVYVSNQQSVVDAPYASSVTEASLGTRPIKARGAPSEEPKNVAREATGTREATGVQPGAAKSASATGDAPCTPGVAALGLCTPAHERPEDTAGGRAAIASHDTWTHGSQGECTEAAALMGICSRTTAAAR